MANLLALKIQQGIAEIATSLAPLINESSDIEKLYFAGPSSQLSGLAAGDAATVATKLTKQEIENGIGLVQQMKNFFGNSAVTTGDYNAVIQPILYGNNAASSPVSVEVEAIGNRLYLYCESLLAIYKKAKDIDKLYWSSEVGNAVGAINSSTVFYGIDATGGELILGITLTNQILKLIDNVAVTTADYAGTIAKWQRLAA